MRFTVYPWDLRAWRSAFRIAGLPGVALFFLLLGSMLQVADTSGGGAGHSSAAAIILVRTPCICIAFLLLLFRPRIARVRLDDMRVAYAAFACLYLASALWSQERVQTIGKAAELLLAGLVFLEASRSDRPVLRIEGLRQITLLTMSTLGSLAVLGFCARLPGFVQQRAGLISGTTAQAPFLSGNGLGYVGSAIILIVLAEWQAHRIPPQHAIWQLLYALALFSVSASRTSLLILVVTVLIVVFKRSKLIAALVFSAIVLAGAVFWTQIVTRLQGHESQSDFVTLSGRTVVWHAAVLQFEQHPLIGVGGGIGGKEVIAHIGNQYLEEMSSLHNGFLEILTGLGILGFILGSYMLVMTTWRAWNTWASHPQFAGTYVLIVHVWLTTTMSTGLLGWMGYEVALFLCIAANLDLVAHRERIRARVRFKPVQWSAEAMTPPVGIPDAL